MKDALDLRHPQIWQLIPSVLLMLLGLLLPIREGLGQERRCQCDFAQKPWEAYGTRAACTAVTANGKTSCNISFGGAGADSKALQAVIGQSTADYQRQFYEILIRYLSLLRENNRDALTEPAFLRSALLMFMRGGYLRDNIKADLKQVDEAVAVFVAEEIGQIRDVFGGAKPPFSKDVRSAKFTVERGAIRMDFKDLQLLTIYLPAPR